MKLIRLNNYLYFLRLSLPMVCLLFSPCSKSQTAYTDTSVVEVADTLADTSSTGEVPNYFDLRASGQNADTIHFRHVPATVMDSLKHDDAFWYANTRFKKKEPRASANNSSTPRWVKNLIWILIVAAFFAALIWYLTTSNILIFAKARRPIHPVSQEEEMSEDIFAINYNKELDKAIAVGDYRLAIRLMFLRLLKNLSNKNIIQYRQGRTNFEYLSQLFSTRYYNDFFRLTRNYEYAWYGKFEVSGEAFKTIRNDFENFDHQLK